LAASTVVPLALLIFLAALLYAAVGQAGASAYLAVMALFGLSPDVMRPTALSLNILVATIAMIKFYRAGFYSWRLFLPFAATSIPAAFIGGRLSLPGSTYQVVVGLVLIYAAYRIYCGKRQKTEHEQLKPPSLLLMLALGAGIGLISGLIGLGGGILLSPMLVNLHWADVKQTAGISAAFILVNSVAGLLGQLSSLAALPAAIPYWAAAAGIGGWIGAEYGSRRLGNQTLHRLLALVLILAAIKMMFQ